MTSSDPLPGSGPDGATAGLADELLRTVGSFRRSVRKAAGPGSPFGPLTGAQAELIRLVRRQPGISVAAAAADLRVAANTVSTLVRQLSEAGLLLRDVDPADRRVARLHLTGNARHELARWRDHRVQAVTDALTELAPDRRRILEAALPALTDLTQQLSGEETADG